MTHTKIHFTDMEFLEFSKIINDLSGIDLNEKRNALEIKLPSFLKEMHIESTKEFLNKLVYNKELKQKTLDFVTVNETYFFRELQQLKEAVYYIKSLDRPTSVLSAPCSSGEEVYSFAILAAMNAVKDLHITGVDINQEVIEECKRGVYEGRTLDRLGEAEKRRYFTNEGPAYKVKKQELCYCRFDLCNVFEDKFLKLGKFDVILSRNMMIYFDYESRVNLMQRFHKIANTDARFYAGNSDQVPETPYFTKVFVPRGSSYYVKNEL